MALHEAQVYKTRRYHPVPEAAIPGALPETSVSYLVSAMRDVIEKSRASERPLVIDITGTLASARFLRLLVAEIVERQGLPVHLLSFQADGHNYAENVAVSLINRDLAERTLHKAMAARRVH